VGDLADLLREEQGVGALSLRADGLIYHDTVVGTEPDVERAASIVELLLR
jgi:hypothetical protein